MPPKRKNTTTASVTPEESTPESAVSSAVPTDTKVISLESSSTVSSLDSSENIKTIAIDSATLKKKPTRKTKKEQTDGAEVVSASVIASVVAVVEPVVTSTPASVTATHDEDSTNINTRKKPASRSKVKQGSSASTASSSSVSAKKVSGITNVSADQDSDNIIIHLPIHSDQHAHPSLISDAGDSATASSSFKYDPHILIPSGYEATNDGYQYIRPISTNATPNFLNSELVGTNYPPASSQCQYPFDMNAKTESFIPEQATVELSPSAGNGGNSGSGSGNGRVITNINVRGIGAGNSMEDIKVDTVNQLKSSRENDIHSILRNSKTNVEKCLTQMDDCNKTGTWAKNTSVHCWWCCHPFDNPPCAIPNEFKNGVYNVYGVFCSPECAAAYSFDDTRTSTDIWERYTLLNMLYRNVYSDKHYKIKLAPPRQTLKIFGGSLSIKEFRANFQSMTHSYKIVMPPMISIIPVQELSSIDKGFTSKQDTRELAPSNDMFDDTMSMSSTTTNGTGSSSSGGLRLKRSKPFVACKNTLNKCMQITVHREEPEATSDNDSDSNDSNDSNDSTDIGAYDEI